MLTNHSWIERVSVGDFHPNDHADGRLNSLGASGGEVSYHFQEQSGL